MIRTHIEQAIRNLEAEKQQKLREVEQRVTQDKIAPYNKEIDTARDKAIQQLSTELNAQIKELQDNFALKKEEITAMSEQRKKEYANDVVFAEAGSLIAEYDYTIAELKKHLKDTQE